MPVIKRQIDNATQRVPPAKKRKLSSTYCRDRLLRLKPPSDKIQAICDRNERTCGFFKLPAELRLKIYTYVLGGRYIRIEYKPHVHRVRQLKGVRYKEHIPGGLWHHSHADESVKGNKYPLKLISRTCRQFYADTVLLHYSLNIFSFNNAWVMRKWMNLRRPVQKRAIVRLDLSTAVMTKTLVKQMQGLQEIFSRSRWMDPAEYLLLLERSRETTEYNELHSGVVY